MPLGLFSVSHLLLDMQSLLTCRLFPCETSFEESKFSLAMTTEIASWLGVGACVPSPLSSRSPSGADLCWPLVFCVSAWGSYVHCPCCV